MNTCPACGEQIEGPASPLCEIAGLSYPFHPDSPAWKKVIEKSKRRTCPACHGQGTQYNAKLGMRDLCPACEARGWIENPEPRK
jgi:hypothetical protein